jgi:hypothetical protein
VQGENHRDIKGFAAEGVIANRVLDGHRSAALVWWRTCQRCPCLIRKGICRWSCIAEPSVCADRAGAVTAPVASAGTVTVRDGPAHRPGCELGESAATLVSELPDGVVRDVREGRLSCQAATSVLSPLARANSDHAEALLAAVREQALSTRELRVWLQHYQGATRQARERMVQHPKLFLQAQLAQEQQPDVERLRAGPEGQCLQELQRLRWWLRRVRERLRGLSAQSRAPELLEMIRCVSAKLEAWHHELQPELAS